MTSTDQLKTIDNRIKASQAQYNVDRLAAIIFAKSSNDLLHWVKFLIRDWINMM